MNLPFSPDDIDAVLFDMDGTLVDTDNVDATKWAERLARFYKVPERAQRAGRRLVMFKETPGNFVFAVLDVVGLDGAAVRAALAVTGGTSASLPAVPGIVPMVERLAARYRLGVVSTRTEAEEHTFLGALGIEQYFEAFVGRDTTWRIKPHPQPVLHADSLLKIPPERTLMVGDTTVDVRAARRAGAWSCAVLCGYGQRDELERAGAHLILDNTAQLGDLLLGSGS